MIANTLFRSVFTLLLPSVSMLAATDTPASVAPATWGDATWNIRLDPATGALTEIQNKNDPHRMNWLRAPGRWEQRNWMPDTSPAARSSDSLWGLVSTSHTGLLHAASVRRVSDRSWETIYVGASLTVAVRREIDAAGDLVESYTFKNTGIVDMTLPAGAVSISAPFFDQYPDTRESLEHRCHAHIWTGGASSWVNAQRMGDTGPHLGLVVTEGALDSYDQRGGTFNDRGVFLLNLAPMTLAKRGGTATFAWKLFWHGGWDDFFQKLSASPGFVRLAARDYVVTVGRPLEITAESAVSLAGARLFANGRPVEARTEGGRLHASIPTSAPGDFFVALDLDGRRSVLRAFIVPPEDALIDARVKFIVRHQQRHSPGQPLDGAYLCYDNETGEQVYNPKVLDHHAGRERVAMGVLAALYLPLCRDPAFKTELADSLRRYADFIARELENEDGVVFEEVGRRRSSRIYNFPWVADFHLRLYLATGDGEQLDRCVRVIRAYYATKKATVFYPIGMPIADTLTALEKAGRLAEHAELLASFRRHADHILENGLNYPRSEVNFEQSIVGPGVQILAEFAHATGESRYLEGAKPQMTVLTAFAGRQPDARLHEVAIRHWDDFWFGKLRVYGDTMPHYWSTINAVAYAYYGLGVKDASWLRRADAVNRANLTLFTPEGAGSAAHLYARETNGVPGARNDPWANDQDWALVNLLKVRALAARPIAP